jgi:hypothetical protein
MNLEGMSMAENMELQQELDCELINIIVKVPENTVACGFTAKMLMNGELKEAHMDMTPEEFRQARKDFLDNVEEGDDYDQVYVLTEKAKRELGVEE